MSLGYALWVAAVVIAVLVGISKFAGINLPVASALLMRDSTLSMFAALGLALASKFV